MNRETTYAWCQLIGWSSFSAFGVIIELTTAEWGADDTLMLLFQVPLGFLASHLLRYYLRRHNKQGQGLWHLMMHMILGTLPVCAVLGLLSLAHIQLLPKFESPIPINFPILWFNWCFILFVWCAIYLGVHYFIRLRSMEIEGLKLKVALNQAQLNTLRSQLNPHFIFNMLNSLRSLIEEDPAKAREVVTRLSRLLRSSLQDETGLVTMNEELASVRDYLSLESFRLEERLCWEILEDPAAANLRIPRMLVLNLVENAIKHGISPLPLGGAVRVHTRVGADDWEVEVTNSGRLNEPVNPEGGLGLRNSRERLLLCYGENAHLSLLQLDENQVVAALKLPLELKELPEILDVEEPPAVDRLRKLLEGMGNGFSP